ncbi:acyl-CoA dehydrogenase [Algiphilus sp.]|uniref:acyl-CoA dehydrogenase n=1 Tax=Algiphilus sp. TaxID=1872431 RepID=UPI0032EE7AAB
MHLLIRRRDLDFLLYEWLDVAALCHHARFAQHDRTTFDAVIDAAETLAEEEFASHAAELDANEPTFDGERVHLIPAVKKALDAYIEGGFLGAAFDEADGGLQLPYTVGQTVNALFSAANIGTAGYPFLTGAAANLLKVVGSEAQQARYMRPMIAGRFFGTMCLSEPQAGSSLGDIRTRAIPQDDGSYRIKGSKMWISGGEHELAENIVHMVLARIDGAPAGTKGISLFVVPRSHVGDDGSVGARNDVRLVGLNHKMGYRGTVNTVLSFGDNDACVGHLVGEAGQGLAGMFHMMNEARIGVGMGAAVLGYTGYLHALDYARGRPQGRKAGSAPSDPPVPIIEHTDVRRMLLAQKAYCEGALALCLYCARLVDRQATSDDAEDRDQLGLLLDILTPIAKAWPSEYGLEANKLAIQVLGGYGYTREYPVERFYRDNRLNPIHEGTNGIQAIDLLGRKVTMRQGAALKLLLRTIGETAERASTRPALQAYAKQLAEAIETVASTTRRVMERVATPEAYLANASAYLDMLGHVVIAWIWLEQALAADEATASGDRDRAFYAGKRQAAQYFFHRELPQIAQWARIVADGEASALEMQDAWF